MNAPHFADPDRAQPLLEATSAAPATESPDSRGSPNGRTAELARWFAGQVAEALLRGESELAARLHHVTRQLSRCAVHDGSRCELPVCPRCECRKARRYRRRQEARLRQGGRFALVTFTLACDELNHGARALLALAGCVRRRVLWQRAVVGGEAHLQIKRSGGEVRRWNVHVHALVQLRDGAHLEGRELRVLWTALLNREGLRGSADVRTLTEHWALHRDPRYPDVRLFVSMPAFYVTRRKPGHQLPTLPPEELDEILRFLPKQRRVSSFGCWRKARRKPVVPPNSERKSA